jgi:hypothetical protein
MGVEVELLAPPGASRADLAHALAQRHGGHVRRVLHQDTEPSQVPGTPIFSNLTLGFEAVAPSGDLIARCVDDLTLQDDLRRAAPPRPGWWRVVSDDERILRLLANHIDPALDLPDALAALPALTRGHLLPAEGGMFRLIDAVGMPLAIAAPLPGERERPCEVISPPIDHDLPDALEALLAPARALGFRIPAEGATHLHFDAADLQRADAVARLVNTLSSRGPALRALCATPARFRRVGGWPAALLTCVNAPDFPALPWPAAQARLQALKLSKYCDFNLKNLASGRPDRHTFEVRILPASLDPAPIIAAAALFEAILRDALLPAPSPHTSDLQPWLAALPMPPDARAYWLARAAALPR